MKLGLFMMPLHPLHRDPAVTLQEDREAIILADQLGYHDAFVFKTHEAQDDAELTDDYVVERLVISGTVNQVVDEILKLREQAGDFGELVYAGMDWVDPRLARRLMELMATEDMPRVNRAIGARTKDVTRDL